MAARPRSRQPDAARPAPFLKWAGGKRQLLPELRRFYPAAFGRYFEPFLGSGAVFFDLAARGRLESCPAILTDTNVDVIGCYVALRDRPHEVIAALQRLAASHARDRDAHYYEVRDGRFNPARQEALAASGPERELLPSAYTPDMAAMLIYLNRTGFNGLFRMNASGRFNVPAGRYANPGVCDAANLTAVARTLARRGVELGARAFDAVLDHAVAGDFVYLDPPYVPLSSTARFTAYTAGGFSAADHVRLSQVVMELARRGCHVMVSNSTAPLVTQLYVDAPDAREVGLRAHVVSARRAISCRVSARSGVPEYIIATVEPMNDRDGAAPRG